ncbi:phage distal tail protein [Micromonospora chersina]|uniref:phage distal tail protein n=1 Tax=Micromonospora chersina TaxID=47854 RepID=UPI0037893AB3
MALAEGQVQVRDLVLGPGTLYETLRGFDPWTRQVRAEQGDGRAWADGAWSGAEWTADAVVPIPVRVKDAANRTPGGWLAAHQALAAAFAPSHEDIELRWCTGGTEYVLFGRPRMVEPNVDTVPAGWSYSRCAFAALDPTIYSGVEHSTTLGLPSTVGGLTVPVTLPLTVAASVTSGRGIITNGGTKTTGLRVRIDGPAVEPRISLLTDNGTAVVRVWTTLTAGQWLDIDTAARTVYLNGTASRRGVTTADGIGWPTLPTGTHELAFDASGYDPAATATVRWRDTWH